MKLRHFLPVLTLFLPLAVHALPAGAQASTVCHLPGVEDALRCLAIPVLLDAANPRGARLALHVTIAPALRETARPDPLFVLAGGPGQAGSDVVGLLGAALRRVRATRDVVFIDQRGTGRSGKLDCDSKNLNDNASEDELERQLRSCLGKIATPLAAYGTREAARDIEQVRQALGYAKINLWGGSYGTRLAQAYARAYPANVRALLLDGVAAPDQVIPAGGRDAQAALDTLFDQCAHDSGCARAFPALRSEFAALGERLAGGPLSLALPNPRTAAPLELSMNRRRFYGTIHAILYSANDARRLPFLVHSAYQGRWEPFVARSNQASDLAPDSATSVVLHLAVTCAEDVPRMSAQLLADDARGSFLGLPLAERLYALCPLLKLEPVAAAAPAMIEAPALLLSGALDPVTPPRRAEVAMRAMRHAQHLVVASAGHGVSQLGCAPRLLREFLDQPERKVDGACLKDITPPAFVLGSAGPQP